MWGFGRVLRLECPSLRALSADAARGAEAATATRRLLADVAVLSEPDEAEVAWAAARRVARLRRLITLGAGRAAAHCGAYAVTGGLGGLGLRAAALLVERGAARVLLASRSGRVARDGQGLEAQLRSLGAAAEVVACDSAESSDTRALLSCAHPLAGVLHAAGVLRDQLLRSMAAADLDAVLAPKALAASHAQRAVAQTPLQAMCLFSSVASMFGNVGQANYAAANACLDTLALCGRQRGSIGSSLQLPAVGGAGMGAATFDKAQLDAVGAITLDEFAASLSILLTRARSAAEASRSPLVRTFLEGIPATPAVAELHQLLSTRSASSVAPAAAADSALAHALAPLAPSQRRAHAEAAVLRVVRELAGADAAALDAETPLMEAGVDSLAATELSSRLRSLTGVEPSPPPVFEQSIAHRPTFIDNEKKFLLIARVHNGFIRAKVLRPHREIIKCRPAIIGQSGILANALEEGLHSVVTRLAGAGSR